MATDLTYVGEWDPVTNTPVLGDNGAGGSDGEYYIVSRDGDQVIDGVSSWPIRSWIVHKEGKWVKMFAHRDAVVSGVNEEVVLTPEMTDLGNVEDAAQLKREAGDFDTFVEKVTPVAGDIMLLEDSADGLAKKKVTVANLLGGIAGGLVYKGNWDANANVPALSNGGGGGAQGDFYVVGTAGATPIDGESDWKIGDWIVNSGALWHKVDNTDMVHALGGAMHTADTLANLNLKVSDATLDDSGDPRTPIAHAASHEGGADPITPAGIGAEPAFAKNGAFNKDFGVGAGDVCEGNDARLSDSRTPTAHAASHEDGGADEISVANLSGLLADPQTPASHGSDHGDGTDAISAPVPSGKFLKDDGTWDTPAGGGGSAFTVVDAGGGGDYTTIEAAAAAVTHGTIFVRAGLYSPAAPIVLQQGVILVGEDAGPGPGNGVIVDDSLIGPPGSALLTFTGGAPPVLGAYAVKNLTFFLNNDCIGVYINDNFVEISHCNFRNTAGPGNSSIGIYVDGSEYVLEGLISRCTFNQLLKGIEGLGLQGSLGDRFRVELCTFTNMDEYCILWRVSGDGEYPTLDVASSDFESCICGIDTDAHLQADQLSFTSCMTGIEVDHSIHTLPSDCSPSMSNIIQNNCDTVGIKLTGTDGASIDGHATTQCNGNPLHVLQSEHFSIEGCHTNFNSPVLIETSGEGYLQLSLDRANTDGMNCVDSYSLTVDLTAICTSIGGVPLLLNNCDLSVFTGHVVSYATNKAAIELSQFCSKNTFDMYAESKDGICVDIGTVDSGNYSNTFRGYYKGDVKSFNIPVNNDKNIISGATAFSNAAPAIDIDSDGNVIAGSYVQDFSGTTALDVSGNNNSIGSSTFDAGASGTEVIDTGAGNGLGAGGNISTHNKIL